jgi:hypothetical protein
MKNLNENLKPSNDESVVRQRRVDAWALHEKKMLQSINSMEKNKREKLLQHYETMRSRHYRHLVDMGESIEIEPINPLARSSSAESIQATASNVPSSFITYVSATGNDSNPGTLAAPFRTIQRAIDVSSWNIIKVEDGEYPGFTVPSDGFIFIVGNMNNPAAVVINGNGNGTVISSPGQAYHTNILLYGVKITGGGKSGNQTVIDICSFYAENIIIAGNSSNRAIIGTTSQIDYAYISLYNALIYDNHVDIRSGSGIIEVVNDHLTNLCNITIADNAAPVIITNVGNNSMISIADSILYNPLSDIEVNTPANGSYISISCSNIRNYATLSNNIYCHNLIDTDPKFVSPQHGMYQLADDSPCIDAGHWNSWWVDAHLPPAKGTSRTDMGAYGGLYVSAQPYRVAPIGDVKYNYDASGNRTSRSK